MKVRFLQHNNLFDQTLPAGLSVDVESRSWHVYGGPRECELIVRGAQNHMLELLGWLRNRIEIYDDRGTPIWWGIVSRVEVPVNKVKLVADLDEMANAVAVAYTLTNSNGNSTGTRMTTAWAEDQESIEKYGRKELMVSASDLNSVQADALARRKLKETAFPRIFPENATSEMTARIRGVGEWETLDWQYANIPTKLALSYQRTSAAEYQVTSPEIKVAQSFKATSGFNLAEISVHIAKQGAPGELTLELLEYFDENSPGEVLASTTIAVELVGGQAAWVKGYLSDSFVVEAGSRYFLAMSCGSCDVDNFYKVTLDSSRGYPEGTFRINVESGWQAVTGDMPFKLNQNTIATQFTGMNATYKRINNVTDGYAQQVDLAVARSVAEVGVYIKRVGDPGQLSVTLMTDNSNTPGDQVATATIESVTVGTAFAWKRSLFDLITLQPTGKVWLVLSAKQADADNYYELQVDGAQGYGGGVAMQKTIALWVDSTSDTSFKTQQNALAASYTTTTEQQYAIGPAYQGFAQSFKVSGAMNVTKVKVFLKKVGSPGDLSVSISPANPGGTPGGSALCSGTVEALDVSAAGFGWFEVKFSEFARLAAYKKYCLEVSVGNLSASHYYLVKVDGNGGYPGESGWLKDAENVWSDSGDDLPFMLYGAVAGVSWPAAISTYRKIGGQYASIAQSFVAQITTELVKVDLQVRKGGNPGDLSVGLYSDLGGWPGVLLDSYSIDRRRITSVAGWVSGWLSKQPAMSAAQPYWIRVSANNVDDLNYYEVGVNPSGYSGQLKLEQSGTWSTLAADVPFEVYNPTIAHQFATIGSVIGELGSVWPMIAQKVVPPSAITLTSVELYVKKVGLPGSIRVDVCRNLGNLPGEVLGSGTLPEDLVSGVAGFRVAALESPIVLPQDPNGYFLVLSVNGASAISYYEIRIDGASGYAAGFALCKTGEAWAEGAGDMPFRLYANELVVTSQQIQNLLTAYGQFFSGIYINDQSGIIAESFRNGDTVAGAEIEKMLEGGTVNERRLLARVNYDRTVEVWEQPAESSYPDIEMRNDGELYYRIGAKVEPGFMPAGRWVSLEPILRNAQFTNVVTGSQQIFVDGVSWDRNNQAKLTPANYKNPYAKVSTQDG